ncbi:MAG: LPS export ABC transporter periplasmic protein LptC [Gemmatimonadetes bacterium]|nr:LPS export ABC transporter periplasmic protein LptC [Gemmatimonadota bacterium]NIR80401.1 LPS export ABC transporter periplasmic protein LptC [Gemmatimonadota bacterium]NIT89161.1 LPS export ABC transporter periplasmic protein LptC [Gemmatimonadota bacterium]NIU32961.1 LPS export ABC transporter periplasmic protein LptC [Gemmatimonadota bacterium]NIU37353.1 LPS export ABC transporter periplasmic protein LptC [Gemmatimonadota bacterium]
MCDSYERCSRSLVTGAALLATLLVGACSESGDSPVVAEELARMEADNVVYGMSQILTHEGVREGVVRADTAYFYRDSSAVHLRGVELTVYSEETGDVRAEVAARRGRLETESRAMIGRGDVVLRIPSDDRTIRTEVLHYEPGADRIRSDTFTVMEEAGRVTCGRAFRSDLEFRNLFIENARTSGCGS